MDKLIETININQIPFEDIERKMGVPPSAFLNAPDSEDIIDALTTLTNGRSCLTPQVDLGDYNLGFRYARFSLYAKNGRYCFRVHPVRDQEEFVNEFNLDAREIELLYKGEKIIKMADLEQTGQPVECLIQLIPGTNAQVACPRYTIDIPNRIGGQEITHEIKAELTSGAKMTITNKDNVPFDIQIDLVSHNMLKIAENKDRLLRSAGSIGQSQETRGMSSVLGGGKSTKPATSKSKGKGSQAGKNVAAEQASAPSQGQSQQSEGHRGGLKR